MNTLGTPELSILAIPPPPLPRRQSNLVRGGLFCILMGFLTFWVFGLGFAFFSAATIIGVIAMCKDQVKAGILLFVGSLAAIVVCNLFLFGLVMAVFASLFGAAVDGVKESARGAPSLTWPVPSASSPSRYANSISPQDLMTKGIQMSSQRVTGALTPVLKQHERDIQARAEALGKKTPAPDYQTLQRRKELQELRAKQEFR